jgi:hypothetical protein
MMGGRWRKDANTLGSSRPWSLEMRDSAPLVTLQYPTPVLGLIHLLCLAQSLLY